MRSHSFGVKRNGTLITVLYFPTKPTSSKSLFDRNKVPSLASIAKTLSSFLRFCPLPSLLSTLIEYLRPELPAPSKSIAWKMNADFSEVRKCQRRCPAAYSYIFSCTSSARVPHYCTVGHALHFDWTIKLSSYYKARHPMLMNLQRSAQGMNKRCSNNLNTLKTISLVIKTYLE